MTFFSPATTSRRLRIRDREPIPPELWQRPDYRFALATHDIAAVYRLLQQHGVSQRRIAAATRQSQSEISEILKGRRVTSYALLVRIADGLGVPRGLMGLAHSEPEPVGVDVLSAARVLLEATIAMVAALGLSTMEG